jgi:hypothetical protein
MAPVYKFSNAGGLTSKQRYTSMLAGNAVWNPWEPQGAFDALSTVTVPAGGVASITFAGIPNTYKHLQLRGLMRNNSGTGGLAFIRAKLNADATSGNYYGHYLYGSGSAASAAATAGAANGLICGFVANNSNTASSLCASVIDILDYANTSKNKTVRSLTGADFNDANGGLALISGLYMSTNAINSIEITPDAGTGFVQYSTLTLYGVR